MTLEAAIERARQRGEAGAAERKQQASQMRTRHPEFAAFVDDYRRVFGARLAAFGDKGTGYSYRCRDDDLRFTERRTPPIPGAK